MRNELLKQIDVNFDPTDSNAASEVVEAALKLMEVAARAVRDDNNGMRMGRDNRTEMSVAIMDTARAMRLLPYNFSAGAFEAMFMELCK